MNKEDILFSKKSSPHYLGSMAVSKDDFHVALNNHAFDFLEWVRDNEYAKHPLSKNWYRYRIAGERNFTTAELYDKFNTETHEQK